MSDESRIRLRSSLVAIARDFFIEGIWRGVKRRTESELIRALRSVRPSSFPLISGDGFRIASSFLFENGEWRGGNLKIDRSTAFIDLTNVEELVARDGANSVERTLLEFLGTFDELPNIVLHNGDLLPPEKILRALESVSSRIFSANLLEETPHRTALPLGIENLYLNRNGRIHDFLATSVAQEIPQDKRTRVFASFAVRNNELIRGKLVDDLDKSRFAWNSRRITPFEHRQQVLNSKFVLSPPGRGADCHRTWESLYLGAVPVVLKGYLAPSLVDSLPIHAVDSYSDFLELTDSELDVLYLQVRGKPVDRAFMPHWLGKILSFAGES